MHRLPALPTFRRYAVAFVAVVVAWACRAALDPLIGADQPLFLWFVGAVVFSAWYGGLGPGLFATLFSAAVAGVILFEPHPGLFMRNPGQLLQIVVFIAISTFVSLFCGHIRRSREQFVAVLSDSGPSDATGSGSTSSAAGELLELARLKRLEGEMGRVVAHSETLPEVFQGCVGALVTHARATFARIWTLDATGQTLELQASAGLYTHLDGPHSRVPVGKFKIGLIASEKMPHLTNNVQGDPRVGDQEWARRERMVAFAGYPLLVGGQMYGVLAIFAREKLSDSTLATLALVANTLAITIRQRAADNERQRLLSEAQQAREVAESASRAKDEFIAVVSHELRTPLNAILGWARLLAGDGLDPKEVREAVAVIERNALSQSQLIEDLLDISRIISGKLRLDLRTVDVPEVVQEAVRAVQPGAENRGLRIESVLDPRAGPVSGDPDRLRQIVWNLLSNAVKFTPKGGKMQVRLSRVNSHVELAVSDTGIGIAPDFLPHVFERFTQADSSSTRSHSGLGLGLGISRHLVELHGGTISAHSDGAGKGSTFLVTLPIMIVHAGAGRPERAHPTAAAAAATSGTGGGAFHCPEELDGITIVAVDDDADARKLLQTVLTHCRAKVTVVATPAEALEAVRRLRPDVLLSDIEMPGTDGYMLISQVRALPRRKAAKPPPRR